MMNEHPYFHWDLLRQPLQSPQFGMGGMSGMGGMGGMSGMPGMGGMGGMPGMGGMATMGGMAGMGGMGTPFFDVNSILELRKEKSRDAARSRRGKENYEFYELAKLLPLPAAITSQLDKASIIRLTISYLRLRDFSCHGSPQWTQEDGHHMGKINKARASSMELVDPFESRQGTHILQSLDGFAFILANDGRFLYISETVSIYLGLSQVEMAGSSIFDYVHPDDHSELAEYLDMCLVAAPAASSAGSGSDDGSQPPTPRPGSPTEKSYTMLRGPHSNVNKSFSVRMKSTLTKRGVHVKTSGYRVVHVLGSLRPLSTLSSNRSSPTSMPPQAPPTDAKNTGDAGGGGATDCRRGSDRVGCTPGTDMEPQSQPMGMVGMAIALPPPTITELRLELDTFITRLTPDFKVVYCEPIINDLMDLHVDDVTDRLLYDLCHPADLKSLQRSHTDILRKGQALTDYYRLMNRTGGFVWVQTCATSLLNNKNSDDQSILAINYVVSGAEEASIPLDLWQLTGDVAAVMSSSCDSAVRREKLKELKANGLIKQVPNNTRGQAKTSKRGSGGGGESTKDDKADTFTDSQLKFGAKKDKTSSQRPDSCGDVSNDESEDVFHAKNSDAADNNASANSMNKRRKMDKPKKRARSREQIDSAGGKKGEAAACCEGESAEKALNLTRHDTKTRECSPSLSSVETGAGYKKQESHASKEDNRYDPRNAESLAVSSVITTATSTPVPSAVLTPEDLSMKRPPFATTEVNEKIASRNIIQHSSFSSYVPSNTRNQSLSASDTLSSTNLPTTSSSNFSDRQRASLESNSHSPLLLSSQPPEGALYGGGSSVQDLEAAMSRHLPGNSFRPNSSSNENAAFTSGFSSSSFTSIPPHGQTGLAQPHSASGIPSLIAVGHPSSYHASGTSPTGGSGWLTPPRATGSDVLTASNFLRSLYAASTRESVIKTGGGNGRTTSEGATSSVSRAPFIDPDLPPSTLLTPPEPDPITYRAQSRGRDVEEDTYKGIYSYRAPDSFISQANFHNHQHHLLGAKDFEGDSLINRDHAARTKDLFPPSPFLPFKDYPQNYPHHPYLPISDHGFNQGSEYPHQQTQHSNIRHHGSHLHQSFTNPALLSPPSASSVYRTPDASSSVNPPSSSSSPYKDVIPTFSIPSLMSPTTPGPVAGSGIEESDGGNGRKLHEALNQHSVNFAIAPSQSSHLVQQQQPPQPVDTLSMTPPASASPDPNKMPPLSTPFASEIGYPGSVAHSTGRQTTGSNNNLSGFPYQHPYSNSLGKDSSDGVIKGAVYGMGSFMDLNHLNSGASQYDSCPRPVLSWY